MNQQSKNTNDHVLLLDKPLNWTSFDVVKKIKYAFKFKKLGHAGTLDPLATGLLVLCSGKKTKSIEEIQKQNKVYEGTINIGFTTPSYDLETKPENPKDISGVDMQDLEKIKKDFVGKIEQTPPIHSAVKKDGKRAYELARKGESIKLNARKVTVYSFDILKYDQGQITFKIECSKGTYIRSIANDFGEKLGTGGYLSSLRRTKIGDYSVKDALSPEEFIAKYKDTL